MPSRSATLRKAIVLLLAAALLLPALAAGKADPCCPPAGGKACDGARLRVPGGGQEDPRGDDGHGEGHERALCPCGSCTLLSLVTDGAASQRPVLSGTVQPAAVPVPRNVPRSTPERPPSA